MGNSGISSSGLKSWGSKIKPDELLEQLSERLVKYLILPIKAFGHIWGGREFDMKLPLCNSQQTYSPSGRGRIVGKLTTRRWIQWFEGMTAIIWQTNNANNLVKSP
jgi:hypothetical protein